MSRSVPSQVARVQALHAAGHSDVMIATKRQIGLVAVRRILAGPAAPVSAPASSAAPRQAAAPEAAARPRRRIAIIDGPSPVDVHVGRQVRLHRTVAGLSQGQLADAIGLTFQQVQKYERGNNRISASMLTRIAATLGVPIDAFFPDYQPAAAGENDGVLLRREAIELSRAYERIRDPELRAAVMDLFVKLGQQVPAPAPVRRPGRKPAS